MGFSQVESKKIDRVVGGFCRRRTDPAFKDELGLEYDVNGHDVIVFERRPRYGARTGVTASPVAKLKFVRSTNEWRLYWHRQDLKWYGYEPLPLSKRLEVLVAEIDRDRWAGLCHVRSTQGRAGTSFQIVPVSPMM